MINKTIVALATPPGQGAIHIIRLSGINSYSIINKVTKEKVEKTIDRVQVNSIVSQQYQKIIDKVVLIKFYKPNSYTGEDLIEINCHGNNVIVNLIIQELIAAGASLANKGDFTKRALLNEKMTLDQIDNLSYLFNAKSPLDIYSINESLSLNKKTIIQQQEQNLFNLMSEIEIMIDYPPEISAMEKIELNIIHEKIDLIYSELNTLYLNSRSVKSSSFRVLLCGKPNVGKSSLINYLLNKDKVIVSDQAGTTRDILEFEYIYKNYLITLVDSAGIRETEDPIEKISILKTKEEINLSNLIIWLIDSSDRDKFDRKFLDDLPDKNPIIIYTKSDLNIDPSLSPSISTKNNDINALTDILDKELKNNYLPIGSKSEYIISEIFNAVSKLKELSKNIQLLTIDIIADELKLIRNYLLNCLFITEDNSVFINKMFDNFCLGK